MPTIFVGHGSPLNLILDNSYTRALSSLASKLSRPEAILVISAHWETRLPQVHSSLRPQTIYDFSGFPNSLKQLSYPAPGAPELAANIVRQLSSLSLTGDWGLDHGAWAVLRLLFPEANVPVLPLSLGMRLNFQEHFELARSLRYLREQGVLVLSSGNITHNLGDLDWDNPEAAVFPWAEEFDQHIWKALNDQDDRSLITIDQHPLWKRAHPRREHYLPLLYLAGTRFEGETIQSFHEGFQHGSLSMRCLKSPA